jgi:ribosomal protein S8
MKKNIKYLLLNLKNCSTSRLNEFYCEYNQKNTDLIELLYNHGFIQSFVILKKISKIYIILRYFENKPVFNFLKLFSKSVNIKNVSSLEISRLQIKRFVLFLNTNQGFMSLQQAKKKLIGGKILFIC